MLTGKNAQFFGKLSFGKLPPDRRVGGFSAARAVGAQVPKLTRKAFEKFGFHTAEILTDWTRIAGSDVAQWTAPERIRWPRVNAEADGGGQSRPGGTLTLRVEPARALDIEYRAAEIIDRINRYFGYRAVATLKLIQAPLDRNPSPRGEGPNSPAPLWGRGLPDSIQQGVGDSSILPPPMSANATLEPGLSQALARLWDSVCKASGR